MSVAVIALWAALAQSTVPPPPAPGPRLSLEQAVEIALARNPEVLAAQAGVAAARGRTLQLGARPEPQIVAEVEGLPLPGAGGESSDTEFSLGLEQVFEYPGKRALREEAGRRGEEMAEAGLERVRILLEARVRRAYWTAVFAAAAAEALERSASRLDALIEDVREKYRTGAAGYGDVLRARAERARLKNQILDQAREKRAGELALGELLGLSAAGPPVLTTPLPFVPLEPGAEALVESARTSRPSFRLAALRVAQAEAAVKLAGLGRRPDLLAGLTLPSQRFGAWGVSLGLTLPFLRPGRARGQAMEAAAEAEAGRSAAAALELRARSAVESAFAAAKSAEAQVLVYDQGLLREIEDELTIELEYFRFGKTGAFALLDLHRTYALAQVERLRALLLYNLARVDLEVAGEFAD